MAGDGLAFGGSIWPLEAKSHDVAIQVSAHEQHNQLQDHKSASQKCRVILRSVPAAAAGLSETDAAATML